MRFKTSLASRTLTHLGAVAAFVLLETLPPFATQVAGYALLGTGKALQTLGKAMEDQGNATIRFSQNQRERTAQAWRDSERLAQSVIQNEPIPLRT